MKSSFMVRSNGLLAIALSAVCGFLVGCDSLIPLTTERRVNTSEEVANIFVSAYPAVPWSSISEKLQPQHNLSTSDARALAAVTTQAQVNQFLSTFSVGLALGLPSKTSSSTTNTSADGTTTTTGTKQASSGSVPASSGMPSAPITDSALAADFSKTNPSYGMDASTQLMVGTGVYQLAKILDNQITNSIQPKGYEAHLLTFQINLQPLGRNLPYDAYVNITLLPGSWKAAIASSRDVETNAQALPPVIVYPLVVTDAMETASVARSQEVIRQAVLQLSGIVANAGLNFGIGGGTDRLESIVGSDRNSVVTLGRVSDHTIRVRLGAQAQGSRKLAIVPRTHNVSIVVFSRAGTEPDDYVDRLSVITQSSFVDVDTGTVMPSTRGNRELLHQRVIGALRSYGYMLNPQCASSGADEFDLALDLLRAVDRSDYGYVSKCLSPTDNPKRSLLQRTLNDTNQEGDNRKLQPVDEARLRRLMAQLMTTQVSSRYSKLLIQLTPRPDPITPIVPPHQLAFLVDDGQTSASLVLREGKQLKPKNIQARLEFRQNNQQFSLLPIQTSVDADGALHLTFPSLVANDFQIGPSAGRPGQSSGSQDPAAISIVLCHSPPCSPEKNATRIFPVRYLKRVEKRAPGNPVSVGSVVLVADSSGTAKVTLLVGAWDSQIGALGLQVSGADVRVVEPTVSLDMSRKAVPLSPKSAVTLTLGNLSASQPVQLRTLSNNDTVGAPIVMTVEKAK